MRAVSVLPLEDILEKDFAAQVHELARLTGWRRYHTYRSSRSPSGFPDEVLLRERIVYLELKREKTRCTPSQRDWLRDLDNAGGEVYVVRPRNLDALAAVLTARGLNVRELRTGAAEARDELLDELRKELAP